MNKNLRKIIAIALAFGTVSAVLPAANINLLTTKAYADTSDEDDGFDSLEVLNKNDDNIKVYENDDYDSEDRLDDDEITEEGTYYIKTSSDVIKFDGSSNIDSDRVKVFKGTSGSAKGKDLDDDISITDDTTITVRVYDEDVSDETLHYDNDKDDNEYDVTAEYEIDVKYTGSDSDVDDEEEDSASTDADDYDDIYLDTLAVGGKEISLSEDKVAYSYSVSNSTDEVTIKAEPDDEDYDVTIDGDDVDDSDNWKKTVSLSEGENKFEIEVENDDNDSRTYTLTINRAKATTAATNTATTQPNTAANAGTTTTTFKVGWVLVNGRWQYNDSWGRSLKSQWFFDRNYGKWYYLGADGNMQTGWILEGGKYYYLNADGSMAVNTTISGYKLGSDGAWVR